MHGSRYGFKDLMVSHGGHIINPGYDYLDVTGDEEFINIFIGYLNLPETANEKNILIEKLLARKHTFPDEIRRFIGVSRKLEK